MGFLGRLQVNILEFVLDRHPLHWQALMWFIECGRRMGNLTEAEGYLKTSGNLVDQNDPGFGYCQGMFEW